MLIFRFFLSLLSFCLLFTVSAQEIEWHNNYGGSGDEGPSYAVQTADGGFLIAGGSNSSDFDVSENEGSTDLWLIKLDGQGALQWERSYGGSGVDRAYHIIATSDGNFIIAANTDSKNGDVSNSYGDTDAWILKIDVNGDLIWERSYGGSKRDIVQSIIELESGELVFIGSSESADYDLEENKGSFDVWLTKLNENGDVIWSKNYGGSDIDRANSVIELNENSLVFAAYVYSMDGDVSNNNGQVDAWIVELDKNGAINSDRSFGGSKDELIIGMIQTNDKGFLIGGRSDSFDGDVISGKGGAWLLKLDNDFQIEWENTYGDLLMRYAMGLISNDDNSYEIFTDARKTGFALYGYMKIDQLGNSTSEKFFGGLESDNARNMIQTDDNGPLLIGYSRSDDGDVEANYGNSDWWIIKLVGNELSKSNVFEDMNPEIYPNPTSGNCTIELSSTQSSYEKITVLDQLGRIVYVSDFNPLLDLSHLSSGCYLIRLHSENQLVSAKIIIE